MASKSPQADKAQVIRRTNDILRIRLDGAKFVDVREFVREMEKDSTSAWYLPDGATPLSDVQIRRYQQKADELMVEENDHIKEQAKRKQIAKLDHLYAKAATQGAVREALSVLQEKAKMLGLYPREGHDTDSNKKPCRPVAYVRINLAVRQDDTVPKLASGSAV